MLLVSLAQHYRFFKQTPAVGWKLFDERKSSLNCWREEQFRLQERKKQPCNRVVRRLQSTLRKEWRRALLLASAFAAAVAIAFAISAGIVPFTLVGFIVAGSRIALIASLTGRTGKTFTVGFS